jgi:group I intron endonuclease
MAEAKDTTKSGIYQIRHLASGKIYIGSAVDIKARWQSHRSALRIGRHHSSYLQRAWSKYGPDAFSWQVLELVPNKQDLIRVEQEYLDRFRPFDDAIGYNICHVAGSILGRPVSDETRAKIAKSNSNPSPERRAQMAAPNIGRRLPPGSRAKISETLKRQSQQISTRLKGHAVSSETRAKLVAAASNPSPETRAKMSAAHKGKKLPPEQRAKVVKAMHSPQARARAAFSNTGKTKRRHKPCEHQATFAFVDQIDDTESCPLPSSPSAPMSTPSRDGKRRHYS